MRKLIVLLNLLVFCLVLNGQETRDLSIIPKPQHTTFKKGQFVVNIKTRIIIRSNNEALKKIAEEFSITVEKLFDRELNITIQQSSTLPRNSIVFELSDEPYEGYTLDITPANIIIKGQVAGLFYGTQTLYQLLDSHDAGSRIVIPSLSIKDHPVFKWRGFMLDVSRNFFSVQDIKRYLDFLAMHKMNVFHWHLVDDQGWRIEIKKYPGLTDIGAWRENTQLELSGKQWTFQPQGGFYTQDQIREVVRYAAERFITVVPEIEMPGHCTASLTAYPELSCTGKPLKVSVNWGVHKDIYCAGKETTFQFLEAVLTEVFSLFPSEYIHIGGDEAPKDRWKECYNCQQRMHQEKLANEESLQSYFINRIGKFAASSGKSIIGWDENLEGGLPSKATVMSWRGYDGAIKAARQNHDVIMAHSKFTYFDHYQSEPSLEPLAWAGLVPGGYTRLRKVYEFNPIPEVLNRDEAAHIIGIQANLWTEYIRTGEHLDYMSFPRLSALSEVMWTDKKNRDWPGFMRRLEIQKKRYATMGIKYSDSDANVYFDIHINSTDSTATISLETDTYKPEIFYSPDGLDPSIGSVRYTQPFTLKLPVTVKAASFKDGERISKVNEKTIIVKPTTMVNN